MRSTSRRFLILALLGATAVALDATQAQQSIRGTGSIRGRVIEVKSGAPLAGATVSYSLDGNRTRTSVEADADGRFVLEHVPAGDLYISTKLRGYVGGSLGQRVLFASTPWLDLADGEQVNDLVLRMWRFAAISGTVLDSSGRPLRNVTVEASKVDLLGTHRQFGTGRRAITASDGTYRIDDIFPADYVVSVASPTTFSTPGPAGGGAGEQQSFGLPRLYYPGSISPDAAKPLSLGSGDDLTTVDLKYPTQQLRVVSGHVRGLDRSRKNREVELFSVDATTTVTDLPVAQTWPAADGFFSFPRVAPGSYVVRFVSVPLASRMQGMETILQRATGTSSQFIGGGRSSAPLAPLPADETLVGSAPITVTDRDLADIEIPLGIGGRIKGHVVFDGVNAPTVDDLLNTGVMISGADGRTTETIQLGRIEADRSFSTAGLPPGVYGMRLWPISMDPGNWSGGWRFQSMDVGGQIVRRDAISLGATNVDNVTLTFSDRKASLNGTVVDASGQPRSDVSVYAFPAERGLWDTMGGYSRFAELPPNHSFRFKTDWLPPGDYFIVAVDAPSEQWRESAFLDKLVPLATRIRIAAGEDRSVSLIVRSVR